jgi:hypothetical protein
MVKWLLGIGTIAALVWLTIAPKDVDMSRRPSATEGLPAAVKPSMRENGPLSLAELRWCMTEEVRLEAIQPRLATHPAVDQFNQLAADFNSRCSGRRNSSEEERDNVITEIAASRESIVAAAIEDIQRLNDTVPLATVRAQELLSMLGYDPGAIDGIYGAQTKAAIEAFQREKGFLVDGLLSRKLSDQLVVALARNRTGRSDRVAVAVYVTQGNSSVPISGAEVTISNDQGLQRIEATNERGRAEFVSLPPGTLDIRVQRNGGGATFQAVITEDFRQEVWVVVP